MLPIKTKYTNVTYAENQPEYIPLPAYKWHDGTVVSCWKFGFWEWLRVLFTGRMYISQSTFNQPLTPIRPHVAFEWDKMTCKNCGQLIVDHKKENSYYCPEVVKDLNTASEYERE